jgi:hypothetical protein
METPKDCKTSNLFILSLSSMIIILLLCNMIYLSRINYKNRQLYERFSLGTIDPYSHQLHKLATDKEERWQQLHKIPFEDQRYVYKYY